MLGIKCVLIQYLALIIVKLVQGSIDGISYMDPINMRPLPNYQRGEDPCNPLYWYPRHIPEYCNYRNFPIPMKPAPPLTIPIPVPVPQPNLILPIPPLPAAYPGLLPFPNGVPIFPSNPMLPVAAPAPIYPQAPYPLEVNPQQAGMLPGLPGLVTKDGGINILPFSDAYTDLLENHKNRMIRRRLEKLIQDYEDFPNGRSYRRLRKYARRI